MDDLFTLLRQQPLLAELSDAEVEWLAEHVTLRRLAPGEYLFYAGQEPEAAYLLLDGKLVSLEVDPKSGEETVRARVLPGELVGGAAILEQTPYRRSVRAEAPSELVVIPAEVFRQFIAAHPDLKNKIVFDTAEHAEFVSSPEKLEFQPDEQILMIKRRHWIALLKALGLGPVGLMFGLTIITGMLLVQWGWNWYILIGWGILLVPLVFWTLWRVVDYFNDFYVVTTHRVIHIEQVPLFKREYYEAPIGKVQDVRYRISNVVQRVLNYGDVFIGTASQNQIIFRDIPDPDSVQRAIVAQRLRFASRVHVQAQDTKRQMLRRALGLEPQPPPLPSNEQAQQQVQGGEGKKRLRRLIRRGNPFKLREEHPDRIIWRKHWIVFVKKALTVFLFLTLLVVGAGLALFYIQSAGHSRIVSAFIIGLYVVFFIIGIFWLLWEYEDWRNDIYVLTKDAVIDEEKRPFGIEKEVRRAPLGTIQDVRYRIPNFLHMLLNVGDVLIETAGVEGQLTFNSVKDPQSVVQEINQHLYAYEEARQAREQARIDESVLEILALYHREFGASGAQQWPEQGRSYPLNNETE